jgi:hypothetical protein
MSHFPHGAFVAIHAAQEKRRQDEQEEEEMTKYTNEDLENNWEFKIVRSETGAFRKQQTFQSLLQEEQIAGWKLVEKLDDRRVRLKRRKEDRRKDAMLPQGYDPYRTNYGSSTARPIVLIIIATMLAVFIGLVVFMGESAAKIGTIFPVVIILMILMLMGVVVAIRRR